MLRKSPPDAGISLSMGAPSHEGNLVWGGARIPGTLIDE
jgi:hypothetical protein